MTPSRRMPFLLLSMAMCLFVATTMASPLCAKLTGHKKECRKTKGCRNKKIRRDKAWICVAKPTSDEECSVHRYGTFCRGHGCKWDRDAKACGLKPPRPEESPSADGAMTAPPGGDAGTEEPRDTTTRLPPSRHGSAIDAKFVATLRGETPEDARTRLEARFPDKYYVVVCHQGNPDPVSCLTRNYDYKRVRLSVDEDGIVFQASIG